MYDAVYEASEDSKIDAFGRNNANGIARKLQEFRFLCCTVVWYDIMFKIKQVSKALQSISVNLQNAVDLVESVRSFFKKMRSEEGFNSVVTDARELADKLGSHSVFEKEKKVRPRRVKKQFMYECNDEPIDEGEAERSFKVIFLPYTRYSYLLTK